MSEGYIAFVLHFHLPWVLGHGRWPHGEDWLNEAAAECYLPLLKTFTRLAEDGIDECITIGLTPVLSEQLSSTYFHEQFSAYLDRKMDSAAEDLRRFEKEGRSEMAALAVMWRDFFEDLKGYFTESIKGDMMGKFRSLQDSGVIEIITSAATHGFLPLIAEDGAIKGQVWSGVETYKRRYGVGPRGFWLPECAYRPGQSNWMEPAGRVRQPRYRAGIESFLRSAGIEYTLVDSHMIMRGAHHGPARWRPYVGASGDPFRKKLRDGLPPPIPRLGAGTVEDGRSPYRPYELVGSADEDDIGVCVFVRDPRTSLQVWSGQWGYPGDGRYLEFHKKHWPGGHRYWRVTDPKADLGDKQVYEPAWAEDALGLQAHHFVQLVKEVVASASDRTAVPPVVVCPFDAELFGHWWFEGPRWIEAVVRSFAADPEVKPATLGSYLDSFPPSERIALPEGSWGDGGDDRVWLNQDTTWTWEKVYEVERRTAELIRTVSFPNDDLKRVLFQLVREQLLLEASDWQFLITTGTARDYAEERLMIHYRDAIRLLEMVQSTMSTGRINETDGVELESIERRDACFSAIDADWWK